MDISGLLDRSRELLGLNRKAVSSGSNFSFAIKKVNSWLVSVGLGVLVESIKIKIETPGKGSGYYNWKVYLDSEDVGPGASDLAFSTQSYLYLHELGHHFQEKLLTRKQRKDLYALFGDLDAPYVRECDEDANERSFVSDYAMVHPMDDFSETFAVILYHRMRERSLSSWFINHDKNRACSKKLSNMKKLLKKYQDV